MDREGNRLGCEAGTYPGTDPGGDRDFSGFDQFRYCNSLNVVAQKAAKYWCYRLVPLVSAVMVPVFPFIIGGDRAFTGDSLGFACRYYQ